MNTPYDYYDEPGATKELSKKINKLDDAVYDEFKYHYRSPDDTENNILETYYRGSSFFKSGLKAAYLKYKDHTPYLLLYKRGIGIMFGGDDNDKIVGVYNLNNTKDKIKAEYVLKNLLVNTKEGKDLGIEKINLKNTVNKIKKNISDRYQQIIFNINPMKAINLSTLQDTKIKDRSLNSQEITSSQDHLKDIERKSGYLISESTTSNTYIKTFHNEYFDTYSQTIYYKAKHSFAKSGIGASHIRTEKDQNIFTIYDKKGNVLKNYNLNDEDEQRSLEQLINIIPDAKTITIQTDIQYNSLKEDNINHDNTQLNVNKIERKPSKKTELQNKKKLLRHLLKTNSDWNQEFINTKTQNKEKLEKLLKDYADTIKELSDEENKY